MPESEEWPEWVLKPPGGYFPDDMNRSFQMYFDWEDRRNAWFDEHRIPRPVLASRGWRAAERERRAD